MDSRRVTRSLLITAGLLTGVSIAMKAYAVASVCAAILGIGLAVLVTDLRRGLSGTTTTDLATSADRLHAELDRLTALRPGWYGGDEPAPDAVALDFIQGLVPAIAATRAGVAIGPDSDGSISLEWRRGNVHYAAVISDSELWLCIDDEAAQPEDRTLNSLDGDALIRFIRMGQFDV